jgi:hypothetical protein
LENATSATTATAATCQITTNRPWRHIKSNTTPNPMSSLKLEDVVVLSQRYPDLSFNTVQQFISLASRLKDDILLAQQSSIVVSDPPDVLPPTIIAFLQMSCSISEDCVNSYWEALKSTRWLHVMSEEDNAILDDFAKHGHSCGLCALHHYHRSPGPCQLTILST